MGFFPAKMLDHMARSPRHLLPLCALIVLSGCQIAQQAGDVFSLKNDTNHLLPNDISSFSTLQISKFKEAGHHQGEVLLLQALATQPPALLSVGQDGRVLGWDLQAGRGYEIKALGTQPKTVALGQHKELIAWSDEAGISITCLQGCTNKKTLSKLKVRPASLAFHDLDTSLLIGGLDGRVYRWRFMGDQTATSTEERERMLERYMGHNTMVSGVVGHSVGRAFFSSDWDGKLLGWLTYTADDQGGEYDKNLFKGRFYTDLPSALVAERPTDRGISAISISKDGERVGVGTEDGHVELWQVKGFSLIARKNLHTGRVTDVALSDDGARVASVGKDSKVRVHYTTPDPEYKISPTALAAVLDEISEHTVPQAHRVAFISPTILSVGTKGGEIVEVRLQEPAPRVATPTAKPTPRALDGDY